MFRRQFFASSLLGWLALLLGQSGKLGKPAVERADDQFSRALHVAAGRYAFVRRRPIGTAKPTWKPTAWLDLKAGDVVRIFDFDELGDMRPHSVVVVDKPADQSKPDLPIVTRPIDTVDLFRFRD
jgi:hypothetical protein